MKIAKEHDRTSLAAAGTEVSRPRPELPSPNAWIGMIRWIQRNLLRGPIDAAVSIIAVCLLIYLVAQFYDWAIASAVWEADNRRECLTQNPNGACWAGVITWSNRFLYGRYPDSELWRINLGVAILLVWMVPLWMKRVRAKVGIAASITLLYPLLALPIFLGGDQGTVSRLMMSTAMAAFLISSTHVAIDLCGGDDTRRRLLDTILPTSRTNLARLTLAACLLATVTAACHWLSIDIVLPHVTTYKWGGLFLTLMVAGIGIASALPTGVLLALGRRSRMPVIKAICIVYIELVRSVPLITLMFMATTLFPFFMPKGVEINKLALAIISVCMFASAYMAETVRGGIQAIPHGQLEAGQTMGLGYWRSMGLIVLPQALRAMIPNIVGNFIDLFKGTAVISIFGFYDLTNMLGAISQDPRWIMLFYEPMFVGGAIYFIGCFTMSRYSLYLERKLGVGAHR
jgi:general L-amino acid transport system permease protein